MQHFARGRLPPDGLEGFDDVFPRDADARQGNPGWNGATEQAQNHRLRGGDALQERLLRGDAAESVPPRERDGCRLAQINGRHRQGYPAFRQARSSRKGGRVPHNE